MPAPGLYSRAFPSHLRPPPPVSAPPNAAAPPTGAFARIGLGRPELRAWALYDWANSAFLTVIITAVFPIYFAQVATAGVPAAVATQRFGIATTVGLLVIAALSPILGAVADFAGSKKRFLAAFMFLGIGATAGMFLVGRGDWELATLLFILGNIGAFGSFVFYDALLPTIAREDEVDRVSTAGFALGYAGGGILLALNVAWILKPAWFGLPSGPGLSSAEATLPTRLAFLSVAVWWGLFSIPLFRSVPEPRRTVEADEAPAGHPLRVALVRLRETLRELRSYREAALMLVAFLIYNDGIQTIIRMAAVYGTELGIDRGALIGAILLVQFLGIPFAFAFGALAGRIGAKRAVLLGLAVYTGISVFGYFVRTATHFWILAMLVGMVQGGTQALSRSLFATLIPEHKAGEFFGFFAIGEKFAGILGPVIFTMAVALTGTSRIAILSVIVFFAAGAALLWRVDVDRGRAQARGAERGLRPAG